MNKTNDKVDTSTFEFKLAERVAELKVIARKSLRMNLTSARLTTISGFESDVKSYANKKERIEKQIKIVEFEKGKLDSEHPSYEDQVKGHDADLEFMNKDLENVAKHVKEIEDAIEDQQQGMALIENGTTKVSSEALNDLVNKLITEEAKTAARGE